MVGAAELGFEFKAPVDVAEEGEDFFAQLNGNADEDDQTLQHLTDQSPPPKTPPHKEPPQPEAILQPLIDVTDDADPFAEIMQAEDEAPIAGLAGDTSAKPSGVVEDDVVIGTSQPHHTPPEEQNQAFPASHDLLAELGSPTEDDPFAEIAQAEPESPIPSAVPPAAHSVSDKSWDDLLEEFDEQSPIIPAESPVPDLSIENSREEPSPGQIDSGDVSMSSAWLADSTMDDSFQIGVDDRDVPGMSGPEEVVKGETPVDEPLSFDVPEGWYDDQGVFQWYSPEEKEQVRQAMLGQDVAPAPVSEPSQALQGVSGYGMSENAARRTPQPRQSPTMPAPNIDAYAPPQRLQPPATAHSLPYTPSVASSGTYSTQSSPYAASSMPASAAPYGVQGLGYGAAPSLTPYNPYAPVAQPASNPYAAKAPIIPPIAGPSRAVTSAAAKKPEPVKRVASTAYDPPFLKPQKSFMRPTTASPMLPAAFSPPTSFTPQATPATLPTPPSGPPRRQTTAQMPRSASPYAVPSAAERPSQMSSIPVEVNLGYDPPSESAPIRYDSATHSNPPMGPPQSITRPASSAASKNQLNRNASFASFDPPLRPPSTTTRKQRASPILQSFTPPIVAVSPPPPPDDTYGPPRTMSRGPPSRKPSPMPSFEVRPPTRSPAPARPASPPRRAPSYDNRAISPPPRPQSGSREQLDQRQRTSVSHPNEYEYDDPEGGDDGLSRRWDDEEEEVTKRDRGEEITEIREDREDYFDRPQRPASTHDRRSSSSLGLENMDPSHVSQFGSSSHDRITPQAESYQPSDEDGYGSQSQPRSFQPQSTPYDPYGPSSDPYAVHEQKSGYSPPQAQPAEPYHPSPYNPLATGSGAQRGQGYSPPGQGYPQQDPTPYNPYAPAPGHSAVYSPPAQESRPRGISVSRQPFQPTSSYEPTSYVPSAQSMQGHQDAYGARAASPGYGSDLGTSPQDLNYFQSTSMRNDPADETYVPQQVLNQKPISEDPLGRGTPSAHNIPLAVFGFGGILITAFPGMAEDSRGVGHARTPSYGYASGRGQLWLRTVSDIVGPSALKPDENAFPGPLILDPTLVKGAAAEKKKKESVLKYLEIRAEEIEKGLPYLKSSASRARREDEGKLVLLRLLAAMVIGEGKLNGSPQVEDALRIALQNPSNPSATVSAVALSTTSPNSATGTGFGSLYPSISSTAAPAKATPDQLSHLSDFLSRGEKREAVQYAAGAGLWSHALVISSCVNQDLWREVVGRFSKAELGGQNQTASLKASYALFSGAVASSVDELVDAASVTEDSSSDQWREVVGAVIFNGKPAEIACLDELGHRLSAAGLVNAAQACYLLSPASPFLDVTQTAFDRKISLIHDARDEDAIIFAEIAEYARSLVPVPKGQESPVTGLPQLLPYKLQRAWRAAEIGEIEQAQRYCAAVESGSKIGKNGPSVLTRSLLSSLEDLVERLTGTPSTEPIKGLGARKAKPGFDKLGSWIEGRLTKFIAGEEDGQPTAPKSVPPASTKGGNSGVVGPFSHFSTISPAQSGSGSLTRNASTADFGVNGQLGVPGDSRRTSPFMTSTDTSQPPSAYTPSYGDAYLSQQPGSTHNSWAAGQEPTQEEDEHEPLAENGDEGELLNPMAALSLASGPAQNDYAPSASRQNQVADDDDDLGFGNVSLSRGKTPRPGETGSEDKDKDKGKVDDKKPEPPASDPAAKAAAQKSGWLGKWWGKKEGEGGGPIRAKLGDESSMVYDKDLKRWIVKGAKPEAAPAAPAPPPRAQTVSPSRANRPDPTATPPPQALGSRSNPPSGQFNTVPRSVSTSFTETPDGGIRRMKSTLAESVIASDLPPASSTSSGPPPPPPAQLGGSAPPSRPDSTVASLDDLLSRPAQRRPGSAAARKGAKNRYVDVFQPSGAS